MTTEICFSAPPGQACFHPSSALPLHDKTEKLAAQQKILRTTLTRRATEDKCCGLRTEYVVPHPTLRSQDSSSRVQRNLLLGQRSPAAPIDNSFHRGDLVQVQDVDALLSCGILQLQFEQHSTGSQITLAFAAASFCGFSISTCDCFPMGHGFVCAAIFFLALTTV